MGWFSPKTINKHPLPKPSDPKWHKRQKLMDIDPEELGLGKVPGILAIWHTGVKPGWIYIGHTNDLAGEIHKRGNDPEVLEHDGRGTMFCSWCRLKPKFIQGAAIYLNMILKPYIYSTEAPAPDTPIEKVKIKLIPIIPPK